MCVCVVFQSALGWDHQTDLSKHESQTDATKGFGGRYGVQKDRQDKVSRASLICTSLAIITGCCFVFQSAVGWDHQTDLSKHESQTDAAKGFGGKYGVQKTQDEVIVVSFLHNMYMYMALGMYIPVVYMYNV